MSLGNVLNMARTAMAAHQTVLQVASQNISNATTEGYSRQRVELTTSFPTVFPYGSVGTGVKIAGVTQARDTLLDAAFRQGSSLKILFSGERSARLVVARGWDTLPAQSDEYVLNDINSGLPAVHVHLSVLLAPFDPRVFGHNDIVFTSRAGRASQYPLSGGDRSNS